MSMYCENCGHKVPYDAIFCPNCGHNLKQNNIFSNSISNFKRHWTRLSDSRKILYLLATFFIVTILANSAALSVIISQDGLAKNSDDSYLQDSSYGNLDDSDDNVKTELIEEETSSVSTSSQDSSGDDSQSTDSSSSHESSGSGGSYVGSVNSNKFHYPSCGQAGKIKSGNLITFSSREDAISRGYSPCSFCSP